MMDNYQTLWQVMQQVVPGTELEPATLQLELEQYRGKLLNLFQNRGPDHSLRQQVARGKIQTQNFGEVALDYDPDQLQVVEFSDKLRLDEVTCVELLTYAQDTWGNSAREAALGVYFTERLDAARSISRLLALQLFHQLEIGELGEAEGNHMDGAAGDGSSLSLAALIEAQPQLGVVVKFNEGLLREEQGGKNVLISRLVQVIKDHSLDSLGPQFDSVFDQYGTVATRTWYTTQERTELCRALLYAVVLSPTVLTAATVADLLGLLESKAAKVKQSGANAPHVLLQQATCVLLAVVAALSLESAAGGAGRPPAKVADLLRASELQEHLGKVAKAEDGFSAVIALSWALTQDAITSSSRPPGGSNLAAAGVYPAGHNPAMSPSALLETAGRARALGTLSGLLASTAFQLEPEQEHKHLCARMVYKLLTEMLQFDTANRREVTESLIKASNQHMKQQIISSRGGSYMPTTAAALTPPGTPTAGQLALQAVPGTPGGQFGMQQGQQQQPVQDDLSSLLETLAAVFKVRPGLWFDGEAPEAYAYVSSFMSYVAVNSAMQIPDVRVSFLSVMASLAAGPRGSRFILAQFRQNATKPELEHFTWKKLFQSVVAYCRRYEELEHDARIGAGSVVPTGLLTARDDALMPPGDAALLVAYLDLFSAIVANGSESEMRTELQAIEREVSSVLLGLPIYEPLFQLMCHGVPSVVKAAVHRAIAALGRFKDAAERLLQRLLAAAVVATPQAGMDGYAGLPRFDLVAQINEVEARSEDYSETLAFIGLVNQLMETMGPQGLPTAGIVLTPYTQLVLQFVVAHLWQRGYRDPTQKWQLAAVCFRHCQLSLTALNSCPPITPELLVRPRPGLAVLLSLMGGRQLEKALLQHVLQPGYEELAAAMESGAEGPARLAACLEGLRLLNLALEYDQAAAEQLSSFTVRERLAPLHQLLLVPQRRLAVLMQYVLYPDMDVQYEAVKLISQLAARLPNLVALLQPNFEEEAATTIRQGCAQSLEIALLDPSAGQGVSGGVAAATGADGQAGAASNASDSRAEMLLDVILGTLNSCPAPALGHLLLGFDTTAPPQDWHNMTLQLEEFTCMTVLLRALQATALQVAKPVLYAKCLQLLQTVAAAPLTCEPVFRLLHPQESTGKLLPGLVGVLLEPLPAGTAAATSDGSSSTVHAQVASMHQRGYVLRLFALALLRCEQSIMVEPILAALLDSTRAVTYVEDVGFNPPQQNGGSGFGAGFNPAAGVNAYGSGSAPPALLALQHICNIAIQEPSLRDIPAQLQQLQNDMTVDDVSVNKLLTQPAVMEACGVVTQDDHGQPVFDFTVLQRLLHERFEDYVNKAGARGGPAEKLARDAVAAAFRYAQQVNAHALIAGAQHAAVEAWVNTMEIAFTKTYTLINTKTAPGCGPELLHSNLLGILGLVKDLADQQSGQLAETLAGCCRVLLSKLQELASSSLSLGLPGDPLSQVRLHVRCEPLLTAMVECLGRSDRLKGLRYEMYVALLQYLHFCRGSKLGDCPPLVLGSLLAGAGPGTSASQLDSLQRELEAVNSRVLGRVTKDLVKLMQGDVLQPPERGGSGQAVALHLLSALIAADPTSTALADALHRASVPRGLLESVATHAPQILLQPAHKSQAALLVLEAQLSLLLSLAAAGGPSSRKGSTKAVVDAGALPFLTACRALDYTPEQPSSHQRLKKSGSLRYRLVHLISPVLRLVLTLLAGAPSSSGLAEQATQFAAAHLDMLARLLQEAASPATAAWAPGDEELEMAALAVGLLSLLPGAMAARAGGALAGLRRDLWRLWLVLAGHDRKEGKMVSSIVAPLHAAGADGSGASRGSLDRRRNQLLQLRCALARCLKDAVTPAAPGAVGAGGLGQELLVCVGHQAQTTVDAMGRPTLLLIRDTADQAVQDTSALTEDLEDLLTFLQTPDSLTSNAAVAQKLTDWGPGLAALNPTLNPGAQPQDAAAAGSGNSLALVLAGDAAMAGRPGHAAVAAAGGASGFGGLDPAAARRLARQCAARGATGVLQQLGKQLHLLEQCLAIVLLHFVQCLPRPDTAAAMAVQDGDSGADAHMADDSTPGGVGGLGGSDQLLPSPGPDAAAKLGSISDLQFFAGKMRDVCAGSDEILSKVRSVLALAGGGEGGVGGKGAIGAEIYDDSLNSVDLLNRQLKAYLAGL